LNRKKIKKKLIEIEGAREKEEQARIEKEKAQKSINEIIEQEKARIEKELKATANPQPLAEEKEDDWIIDPVQISLINRTQYKTINTLSKVRKAIGTKGDDPMEIEVIPQLSFEERNVTIFAPSAIPFDPRSIEIPDDFYQITKEDLRLNAAIQKQKKKEIVEGVLRTKEMRERDRIKKLSKYKKCFIRIRFPDRVELQGTFLPVELMSSVYQFVRDCLKEHGGEFHIYSIPPKTILKEDNTTNLRDLGFLPACLLYFGINEGTQTQTPFLKDSIITDIKEKLPPAKIYVSQVDQSPIIISTPITTPVVLHPNTGPYIDPYIEEIDLDKPKDESEKKAPSWFMKGKK